jgi:biopolymer transport protein TolR
MGVHVGAGTGGRSRRGRRQKHAPIAEINVTPFVDVMLVLLIVFMVAAPLLTVGVPIELPKTSKGEQLPATKSEPLAVTVKKTGEVFIGETQVELADLEAKLKAIAEARKQGDDDPVFVRGDAATDYGTVMKVMARLNAAGFKKVSLVTDVEDRS